MDEATLLACADLNLIEFNRESARATHRGTVHEEGGLLFFVPGHRFPVGLTGVMRTEAGLGAGEALGRAREFFAAHDQGYTFWLMRHRDADIAEALERAGMSPFGNSPGMVLEEPLPETELAAGTTVERVAGAAAAGDFAAVCAAAYATYGLPGVVPRNQFTDLRFFLQPHVAAFVARVHGEAAAAAMVMVTHGVAGLYWVGTMPEMRGRGLAETCTRIAGNAGFAMGARVAALQASVMGEPVYRRMGYREITRYPWYVFMP